MLSLTHTYVASRVIGSQPYTIAGAILPDITTIKSNGEINLEDEHADIDNWIKTIQDKELVWGITTHKIVDQLSHNSYAWDEPNYVFNRLWTKTFPKYWGKSKIPHIIAESAVELYVAKTYPEIRQIFDYALQHVNPNFIGEEIAQVLGRDKASAAAVVKHYFNIVTLTSRAMQGLSAFPARIDREACLELCISECKKELAKVI